MNLFETLMNIYNYNMIIDNTFNMHQKLIIMKIHTTERINKIIALNVNQSLILPEIMFIMHKLTKKIQDFAGNILLAYE